MKIEESDNITINITKYDPQCCKAVLCAAREQVRMLYTFLSVFSNGLRWFKMSTFQVEPIISEREIRGSAG